MCNSAKIFSHRTLFERPAPLLNKLSEPLFHILRKQGFSAHREELRLHREQFFRHFFGAAAGNSTAVREFEEVAAPDILLFSVKRKRRF